MPECMTLSLFARKAVVCGCLALAPVALFGQTNTYVTNGVEYAIAGLLPGDQFHAQLPSRSPASRMTGPSPILRTGAEANPVTSRHCRGEEWQKTRQGPTPVRQGLVALDLRVLRSVATSVGQCQAAGSQEMREVSRCRSPHGDHPNVDGPGPFC